MPSYLIKPREPTVLSHKEHHEISSTNLILSVTVVTAHIIPGDLDIERFGVALSKALSRFPHLAGRLVRPNTPDAPWAIRLTNSGVPVSVIDSDADEILPTDSTAQTSLPFVELLNTAGIVKTEGESDEPLFRLTITRFTRLNATSIGVCFSHVVCDGFALTLFLRLLSRLYQGLGPVNPPPYYEPEAIKFAEPSRAPRSIYNRYDPSAPLPWEQPERTAMEWVAFRLTATQLTEIHNRVTKGKEHLKILRVDMVVGLLVRCLSEVEPESKPIDTVLYVINHRGMGICPVNAALNGIVWVPTGLRVPKSVSPHDEVLAHATELRNSMKRLKRPKLIEDMVTDLAKTQSQVAWDKVCQDTVTAKEGCLIVNVIWKLILTSPHFGHPGKVKVHYSHPPGSRFVQITTPNPKIVDGRWISREGEMEARFYVPPNRRKRFEQLFEGYTQGFGMTGSVEFLR